MAKAEVDMVRTMRQVTMHLRVKRGTELRWRCWLGMRLILLAARAMNCRIDLQEVD